MRIIFLCTLLSLPFLQSAHAQSSSIERGRYLSVIAGCNECHTAGFAPSGGKIPESEWLLGDTIGFKGPWGTSYPINLRKLFSGLSKEAWIALARSANSRPPMPSYILKTMPDSDLIALYDFIRSLGDGGQLMPAALAPGVTPTTPYFVFEPQNLPPAAK